jgi:hypothetical protein
MTFNLILPFLSFAIMLTFTVSVLQRYVVRRKLHFLFWGIGLGMFAIGSFGEAFLSIGWNRWVFFFWYLCGAVLTAAWIGQGTVYLLFRKPWVHALTLVLVVGSLVAAVMLLQTMGRLDTGLFTPSVAISEQYREIMPASGVRLTTPFFNIYGLVTLAGGALWSAYLFWRKRVLPNRVVGNVLIAAGALSIGLASTLTRLGNGSYLYAGELIAATLMFTGFMVAARPQPQEAAAQQPAAQAGSI